MREILFRGKCKDTGRWYTGYYINLHKTTYCFKEDYDHFKDNDIHQIVFEHMTDWGLPNQHLRVDIIPETIGQYTGLTDKNGTKIFEGDIIQFDYIGKNLGVNGIETVVFKNGKFGVLWGTHRELVCLDGFANTTLEVIGNIHDNPELLGGEG